MSDRGVKVLPKLLSADELAEQLSVKRATIYKWVHRGEIPHYKLGRCVRFDELDVAAWLAQRRRSPLSTRKAS